MRAHQDRRGSAQAGEGASQYRGSPLDRVHGVHARQRRRDGMGNQPGGGIRIHLWRLSRQRRRHAQHRAQGPRHRVRRIHLSRSHLEYRSRLRFPKARLYRAQLHLRSGRMVEPVSLEGSARPLAYSLSRRGRRAGDGTHASRRDAGAAAAFLADGTGVRHRRQQPLRRAPASGEKIPRRARDPRRRLRAREQPHRRHGHEEQHSCRVQPSREAHQDLAAGSRRGGARPLRAPAPARRLAAHAGANHPQQASAGGEGPRGAQAQPRRVAPDRGRPQARARVPAAQLPDREPARSRADCRIGVARTEQEASRSAPVVFGGTSMTRVALALLTSLLAADVAHAQSADARWPERPIRFIVPFTAGSSSDTVGRLVAQKLVERLRQPIVVENRVGGGGSIGSGEVAHADADGYTLGLANTSTHAVAASVAPLSYDPVKDFAPVSMLGHSPFVLALYAGVPAHSVQELIALARAKPRVLNYASAGPATLAHLSGALFEKMAKIELTHVPYRGTAQSTLDLLEGRVEMQFGTIPPTLAHIRAGKLRALAVTAAVRNATAAPGSEPSSRMRATMSGASSALATSSRSFASTGSGVFAGATRPYQEEASKPTRPSRRPWAHRVAP